MTNNENYSRFFFCLFVIIVVFSATITVIVNITGIDLKALIESIYPGCFFSNYLKIYCPGCGGIRACISLIHGDIISSLRFHPFVVCAFGMIIVFLVGGVINLIKHRIVGMSKFLPVYFIISAVVILGQWIIKLVALLGFGIALIPL